MDQPEAAAAVDYGSLNGGQDPRGAFSNSPSEEVDFLQTDHPAADLAVDHQKLDALESVRSILSVPGHQIAMAEKARSRGADRIAWDLEDSVPAVLKAEARERVAAVVTLADMVRINYGSYADIEAVRERAGWINLPKVVCAGDVLELRSAAPRVKVLAVIETPAAFRYLHSICEVSDAVAFGRADFCAATGLLDQDGALVHHAMGQIAMAAHAAGIPAYDSPCERLDEEAMLAEVARAASFGFAGKICIHPDQLAACRRFAPSGAEREEAREIAAWRGSGARRHNDRLLAEPHYRLAERFA